MMRTHCSMTVAITLATMAIGLAMAGRAAAAELIAANPDKKVGQMSSAFAADLYAQLAASPGNLFFSPTSIQTALAMTWAGARGQTAEEMAKTLHLDAGGPAHDRLGGFLERLNAAGKKGGYELSVANALWGAPAYPFLPEYVNLVKKNYGGSLSELNFAADPQAARQTINDWVAKETRDRIKDLLPPSVITRDTRLVLTNAIYFKGKWDLPFTKEQTKDQPFTSADGKKANVPLMYQQAHFRYAQEGDVQALELPYGNNELAMRIFLPEKADGLPALEKQMTEKWAAALAGKMGREDVKVWLPRFTMESEFFLADTLKAMGMRRAFDPASADFKGMTTAEQLFISAVIHKAFVKVDEEGTEAAAATGVVMMPTAARIDPAKPKEFRADHPFIFQIVHQPSGATLFMGRIAAP